MADARPTENRRQLWVLAATVFAGAALRVYWNDLTVFSRADETHYLIIAWKLAHGALAGYARMTREFLDHSDQWVFPAPVRYGYLILAAKACAASDPCSHHTLASISTAAGIASILLAYIFGQQFLSRNEALLGAAFVAVSPLQLLLGRRALQDESVCAVALAALIALVRYARLEPGRPAWRSRLLAIALAALALSFKESFVLYTPALLMLLAWRGRRHGFDRRDLLLLLAPILYYLGYCALTGSFGEFFTMARITFAAAQTDYPRQYQSGPIYRYLIDLTALSPMTVVLAVAAGTALIADRYAGEGPRLLGAFTLVALSTFSLVSKSARFIATIDCMLCLLAAYAVVRWTSSGSFRAARLCAVLFAVAASDLWIFQRLSGGGVYDPTTYELLRALGMLPR